MRLTFHISPCILPMPTWACLILMMVNLHVFSSLKGYINGIVAQYLGHNNLQFPLTGV